METTSCRNKTLTILHVLLFFHAMYMYTLTYIPVHMYLHVSTCNDSWCMVKVTGQSLSVLPS